MMKYKMWDRIHFSNKRVNGHNATVLEIDEKKNRYWVLAEFRYPNGMKHTVEMWVRAEWIDESHSDYLNKKEE